MATVLVRAARGINSMAKATRGRKVGAGSQLAVHHLGKSGRDESREDGGILLTGSFCLLFYTG